jgi:hypothetical protein
VAAGAEPLAVKAIAVTALAAEKRLVLRKKQRLSAPLQFDSTNSCFYLSLRYPNKIDFHRL